MKTLLLVVGLVVGLAGSVFAAEAKDLQRAVGGFITATSSVVIGSAQQVTGFLLDCGGTACAAALYDGDSADDVTAANGRFEVSAAANGFAYVDLSDAPIRFTTGVFAALDGNADAVVVYTSQPTP